jgi:hypothetical protein
MEETAAPNHADVYSDELLALKAANDRLRERGQAWLFGVLENLAAEMGAGLSAPTDAATAQPAVQIGRQAWQFEVEKQQMVGERLGVRLRERTLVVEVGWPRLPEHGYVPGQGLVRGRVGFSQNVMIEPLLIDEIIFKRQRDAEPAWFVIANGKLGEPVTEAKLREYLRRLFSE